jgi:hypothetical protein
MTASSGVVLSNLAYLIGAVVLAIIGGLVVWLHHRQPKSVDANVESFHRGLRALAPSESGGPKPSRATSDRGPDGLRIQPRPSAAVAVTGRDARPGPDAGDETAAADSQAPAVPPEADDSAAGQEGHPTVVERPSAGRSDPPAALNGIPKRAGAETG